MGLALAVDNWEKTEPEEAIGSSKTSDARLTQKRSGRNPERVQISESEVTKRQPRLVADTPPARSQAIDWPYQPSYFLPGKLHRQSLQSLVYTGCNTNILSPRFFHQLSKEVQAIIKKCDRPEFLEDGLPLPFYGVIQLEGNQKG